MVVRKISSQITDSFLKTICLRLFLRAEEKPWLPVFLVLLSSLSFQQISAQTRCATKGLDAGTTFMAMDRSLGDETLLTIPIVFHNLYRLPSQKVTEDQLQSQVAILNSDYQRLNSDASQTPEAFAAVAADCQIGFCLATIDPQGEPSDGINYQETDRVNIGFSEFYYRTRDGGHDIWDPEKYLNIWVCEISESGAVAGFAELPGNESDEKDGIVIDYRYFGSGGTAAAPFDRGRTLTHEIGHWLGLSHTWGDTANCLADDGLDDTPLQFVNYEGCPDDPQFSCESQDMFMNFMDLTHDACMNLFTEDQKEVMRQTLGRSRSSLVQMPACNMSVADNKLSRSDLIGIYPNPATEVLFVELSNGVVDHILIYDFYGALLSESQFQAYMSIGNLAPGLYLIKVKSKRREFFSTVIKVN